MMFEVEVCSPHNASILGHCIEAGLLITEQLTRRVVLDHTTIIKQHYTRGREGEREVERGREGGRVGGRKRKIVI